jgi:hypothetical protein
MIVKNIDWKDSTTDGAGLLKRDIYTQNEYMVQRGDKNEHYKIK